jgi:riboflavin synthase
MFTGLVEAMGEVAEAHLTPQGLTLTITLPEAMAQSLTLGASIAIDGVCTTVIGQSSTSFTIEATPETLNCTLLGQYAVGRLVNLERPVALQTPLGGHVVTGHVDGLGTLTRLEAQGNSWVLAIDVADTAWLPYLIDKGSVAMNGISLTVNRTTPTGFEVAIIPHTWQVTQLHQCKVGDAVHLEFDPIGKYVLRAIALGYGQAVRKTSMV